MDFYLSDDYYSPMYSYDQTYIPDDLLYGYTSWASAGSSALDLYQSGLESFVYHNSLSAYPVSVIPTDFGGGIG